MIVKTVMSVGGSSNSEQYMMRFEDIILSNFEKCGVPLPDILSTETRPVLTGLG